VSANHSQDDASRFLIFGTRRLPVICGGSDGEETPATTPAPDPTPSPEPPAEPSPTPEPAPDPAAKLREEIAELRGELRGRTSVAASAAPPAPRVATAEDIEAAYASGRITLEQRDAAVDDLKFHQRYEMVRARERETDAESAALTQIEALVAKHPEFAQQGSAGLREVSARLGVLAQRGMDVHGASRYRAQLTALEHVLADRASRTSRPTPPPVPVSSGPGSFAGGPPSGTAPRDEYADIPQSTRDYWTRTGIPADKWKAHADAWRANQGRRAARFESLQGRRTG
jgi:hypothetical protein